jgi:hypothetical protein
LPDGEATRCNPALLNGPDSPPAVDDLVPAVPTTVEDLNLDFGFLSDLALKAAYADTNCTTQRAAERLAMPIGVVEVLLQHLYREHFIEIRETLGPHDRRYAMLDRGWERVRRLLDLNAYIGAAPVSLKAYTAMVKRQEESRSPVDPDAVRAAFADLVLPEAVLQMLGVVANSRRSVFIMGASGNGKTAIARALHSSLGGEIWVPRAIEVNGQIINLFDSHNHVPIDPEPDVPHDQRWIKIQRPLVVVGGEMTIESMDLTYDRAVRFYEAPFQVKSNGGTLLIDDFGRQRVLPHDLFNRWIIPLENRVDYLTLHTGQKVQVPFEQVLIFATNLDSSDLAEEAFLRRLGYRLTVASPDPDSFGRIFQKYAESLGLRHDPQLVAVLVARYEREKREMRGCHARDLIEHCRDICRYENRPLILSQDLLDRAWLYYFGRGKADGPPDLA